MLLDLVRRLFARHLRRELVHGRPANVIGECLDWREFIARYDRPETLSCLGPAYFDTERDHGRGLFDRDEFAVMAEALTGIQRRPILSLTDRPEIRETFSVFQLKAVDLVSQISGAVSPARLNSSSPEGGEIGHGVRFLEHSKTYRRRELETDRTQTGPLGACPQP